MAKLSEGLTIQQLAEGAEFEVQLHNSDEYKDEEEDGEDINENLLKYSNMTCLQDDDDYVEGEPFENIGRKMIPLLENGAVKKKIIREGYGDVPPNLAVVKVDYNAYIEYEPQPFDSTYSRKKKHEFIINNGEVIPGLDIAVQSMKLSEKSQFLIQPQYAYGSMGCLGRVPRNAPVLFEIELHEIVDSGAAMTYPKLSEEEKADFKEIYKYCLSLCVRGKEKFKRNPKEAVKEYNTAVARMENCQLSDYNEQEKQQELLLRLFTNILVCYTKLEEPKRGCTAANRLNEMTKGTSIKLPPKVHYCHGKCLRMLGDYAYAKRKLELAHRLSPNSPDIAQELIQLKDEINKSKIMEKQMSRSFVDGFSGNELQ